MNSTTLTLFATPKTLRLVTSLTTDEELHLIETWRRDPMPTVIAHIHGPSARDKARLLRACETNDHASMVQVLQTLDTPCGMQLGAPAWKRYDHHHESYVAVNAEHFARLLRLLL
jgi:hypothetical protein